MSTTGAREEVRLPPSYTEANLGGRSKMKKLKKVSKWRRIDDRLDEPPKMEVSSTYAQSVESGSKSPSAQLVQLGVAEVK